MAILQLTTVKVPISFKARTLWHWSFVFDHHILVDDYRVCEVLAKAKLMQEYFYSLAKQLCGKLAKDEVLLLHLTGEITDFVRFNKGLIRQAGWVQQANLSLELIWGECHSTLDYELQHDLALDVATLQSWLRQLRLDNMPSDPHLSYATTVHNSEYLDIRPQVDAKALSTHVCATAHNLGDYKDLVGLSASGRIFYGFANSLGQRNWHETSSFNLNWSIYLPERFGINKAVKASYAGQEWVEADFQTKLEQMAVDLQIMARPPIVIKPGDYRVYLAPSAVYELLELLGESAFGLKAHKSVATPLLSMVREGRRLHECVTLAEHPAAGLSPLFTAHGFIRPSKVTLIAAGAYQDCLVNPRSAKEFDSKVTGDESPDALDLAPGNLPLATAIDALEQGLWLNNLWYCNISDPQDCRITGMTRFACLWVEHGRLHAPIVPLRFDDSLYRLLGEQLVDLTRERSFIVDPTTYEGRSSASANLPGALVAAMRFTL